MASANAFDETVMHPKIPFLDENNEHVLKSGRPYSPKMTCGTGSGCHDYESITHAYHFEFGRDEASDDYGVMHGLPQLMSPGYYGGYSCMSGSNPGTLAKIDNSANPEAFAYYGSPGFVRDCLSCHVGGGFGEKDRRNRRYDQTPDSEIPPYDGDYYTRGWSNKVGFMDHVDSSEVHKWDWKKSGVAEADCMLCHAKFSDLTKPAILGPDSGEGNTANPLDAYNRILRQTKFIRGGFFRYQASAIWEFLPSYIDGQPKRLLSVERDIKEGGRSNLPEYDLKVSDSGEPILHWDPQAFDGDGKAHIKMLRFPGNDNCMICHRTSNSRRGFYGFGDAAIAEFDDDGVIEEDYMDDVHKGKVFTADNGEQRAIENCNTCHSRAYFKEPFRNVELNLDHNFLKGDSDMDIRNDLDYAPYAKACEHCHDEAKKPIIPSGQANILDAHRELWKANQDMAGYAKSQLTKITKTHLDVVACQTCHITGKKGRGGADLIPLYRYREAKDGLQKIFPYNPKLRYYWIDQTNNHPLARHERDKGIQQGEDADGKTIGLITDPDTGETCEQVSARISHGSLRFGDPETYKGYVCLKKTYDKFVAGLGFQNPNTQLVWISSNMYVLSHNVRPSTQAMPCGDCHTRKQSGSWSSLVSASGKLGEANIKKVTTLPDKRLVDEGIVKLGLPYMKVDDNGEVSMNVGDILYSTKVDSFMTILKASSAQLREGEWKTTEDIDTLMAESGLNGEFRSKAGQQLGGKKIGYIQNDKGDSSIRQSTILISLDDPVNEAIIPKTRYRVLVRKRTVEIASWVRDNGMGELESDTIYLGLNNPDQSSIQFLPGQAALIKIPYWGHATSPGGVSILTSLDGSEISTMDPSAVVAVQPHTDQADGFVLLKTPHTGYFAVTDI
ncbi:MAG: cytochrome C [Gammaproteobacteria bacterium]|nr:cytochrome C [Gammaproteobacteria bacterium]